MADSAIIIRKYWWGGKEHPEICYEMVDEQTNHILYRITAIQKENGHARIAGQQLTPHGPEERLVLFCPHEHKSLDDLMRAEAEKYVQKTGKKYRFEEIHAS